MTGVRSTGWFNASDRMRRRDIHVLVVVPVPSEGRTLAPLELAHVDIALREELHMVGFGIGADYRDETHWREESGRQREKVADPPERVIDTSRCVSTVSYRTTPTTVAFIIRSSLSQIFLLQDFNLGPFST